MRNLFARIIIVGLACLCFVPAANAKPMPDLGFESSGIILSKPVDELVKGERVTVYVSLYNHGSVDATGYLVVEQGPIIVATEEISLAAGSARRQYSFSYTVPNGSFNLMAKLLQVVPADKNSSDNQVLSPVFLPLEKVVPAAPLVPLLPIAASSVKKVAPVVVPVKSKIITPPVKKVIPVKPASVAQSNHDKLVESVYLIPATVQLDSVGITARRVNWHTYDFLLTSNLPATASCALTASWDFGTEKREGCQVIYSFSDLGNHYVVVKVLGPWGNYLYSTAKVNINFFAWDNYWLWGIIMAFIISYAGWKFRVRRKNFVPKEKKSGIIVKTESIETAWPVKVATRPKKNSYLRTFHPRTCES